MGCGRGQQHVEDAARLVDDFFGRAWVEPFCGPEGLERVRTKTRMVRRPVPTREALDALPGHLCGTERCPATGSANPRHLGDETSRPAPPGDDFIVVDVTPRVVTLSPRDAATMSGTGDRADANVPTAGTPEISGPEPADIAATGWAKAVHELA